MPSPGQQRYVDRMKELIRQGEAIAEDTKRVTVRGTPMMGIRSGGTSEVTRLANPKQVLTWVVSVQQIIDITFGEDSIQGKRISTITSTSVTSPSQVQGILGILESAANDLEGGYFRDYQALVVADLFDSVLQQAKHLNELKYKDAAAILGRTVIEDALRRLASDAGIDLNDDRGRPKMSNTLNENLRQATTYAQPMWRQIQAWVDIGNAAAHGRFDEYSEEQVAQMLTGIEAFLATYFTP